MYMFAIACIPRARSPPSSGPGARHASPWPTSCFSKARRCAHAQAARHARAMRTCSRDAHVRAIIACARYRAQQRAKAVRVPRTLRECAHRMLTRGKLTHSMLAHQGMLTRTSVPSGRDMHRNNIGTFQREAMSPTVGTVLTSRDMSGLSV